MNHTEYLKEKGFMRSLYNTHLFWKNYSDNIMRDKEKNFMQYERVGLFFMYPSDILDTRNHCLYVLLVD